MSLFARMAGQLMMTLLPKPSDPVAKCRPHNREHWRSLPAHHRPSELVARVRQRVVETRDTQSLWLEPAANTDLPLIQPGQFFTCCLTVDGQEIRRAYSVSNIPEKDGAIRVTVKKLEDGALSPHLHRLEPGDQLRLIGPSGDFCLPERLPQKLIMIAGGTGITPILGLVEAALARHPDQSIELLYSGRNTGQMPFLERLKTLAKEHPGLNLSIRLTRPSSRWKGERGRVDAAYLRERLPAGSLAGAHAYLCGPEGLMAVARDYLTGAGLDEQHIHQERFLAAARETLRHPTEPQTLKFTRSNQTVTAKPGQSILDAGLAAGLALDYSCQVGGCGSCKIKVTGGEVISDEPNCLSEAEQARGYRLACLSYACSPVEIEA